MQTNRTFNLHDDETVAESMRLYNNLSGQFKPAVDEMSRMYDFTMAVLQWDKDVRDKLKAAGRPTNSYNFIVGIINIIFSVAHDNRKKGKATPRTGGDRELATVVSQTLDFYLYTAGQNRAQRRVWIDKIISGIGVYYMGWKYYGSKDTTGGLVVEAVDPREIMYEPVYNDPLWTNASFIMRKHQMSLDEILNQYALNDDEMYNEIMAEAQQFFLQDSGKRDKWVSKKLKALFSAVYETATGFTTDNNNKNILNWWDPTTGKFDVLELHEKRTERALLVYDSNRQKQVDITDPYASEHKQLVGREHDGFTFKPEIINKIKDRYQINGDAKTELTSKRFVTAVIPTFNLKVNEQPYPFQTDYYVYIPEQCYDYHADPLKIHSVISDLCDPQADFNKSKSLILELLGRYANKGWVMDENAISGLEEDWLTGRIAPYRRVRAGYMGMIKPEEGQTISPELVRMPFEMQQIMQTISNTLNQEIGGAQNSDVKSGVHFLAKEQRQTKSFTYLLENREITDIALYTQALNFIQHFVTTQQVVRILDIQQGQPQEVTVNQSEFSIDQDGQIVEKVLNDLDSVKYDIEMSEDSYSSTAQEDRLSKLGDLFNAAISVNPQKADALLDIIVEEGSYPGADKILQAWQSIGQPDPQQQANQQQMQALQAQIAQIMAKLGIQEKTEDVKTKQLKNLELAQNIKQTSKDNLKTNAKNNALGNLNSSPQAPQMPQQGMQPWQALANIKTRDSLESLLNNH